MKYQQHLQIFYRSKADGESEWKPAGGDENTKSTKKKKPTRKRRKTQTKGFPQENDFVEIDFGEERFEAVVLDAGATLIDIKYTVDGSCEFVDRNDLVPRNMVLLKRPEVGSKVEKEFDAPTKKKGKKKKVVNKFKGVVTKIFEQKGETLFRVKYEDDDEEDIEIMELVQIMV